MVENSGDCRLRDCTDHSMREADGFAREAGPAHGQSSALEDGCGKHPKLELPQFTADNSDVVGWRNDSARSKEGSLAVVAVSSFPSLADGCGGASEVGRSHSAEWRSKWNVWCSSLAKVMFWLLHLRTEGVLELLDALDNLRKLPLFSGLGGSGVSEVSRLAIFPIA